MALLDRAGFGKLEVSEWRGALPVGGSLPAAQAADFALAAFASFSELLASAGPPASEHAHRELSARFSEYERDGAVRIDARVHLVSGVRL